MVNLGLNWSSLLGIILAIAGAGLYFLRTWRPKLARDHDIFFAAIGLLCGGILLFQGWRLDPILAFGQFLLTGTAIFFAVESINLRGATIAQAKSRAPIVDDERPVSRQYSYVEAELDELEPVDEYPVNRRIRGTPESRSRDSYRDGYDDEPRRRSSTRQAPPRPEVTDRPKRRPRNPESPSPERFEDWGGELDQEERPSRSRRNRPTPPDDHEETTPPTRSRKNRPPSEGRSRSQVEEGDVPPTDYVEYRPVEPDEE